MLPADDKNNDNPKPHGLIETAPGVIQAPNVVSIFMLKHGDLVGTTPDDSEAEPSNRDVVNTNR